MSDADPNLVLHLALDEAQDGITDDSSANDNDGKVFGDPQLVPDDTFGSCLRLDGTDDYVELTNAGAALKGQSFTVEAWINARAFDAMETVVVGTDDAEPGRGLRLSVVAGKPYVSFTGDDTMGVTQMLAGVWYHLAWRYDNATGERAIYVNGVQDAAATGRPPYQGAGVLRAGRVGSPAPKFFGGMMAHVRVYTRALAAEEIRQDMDADLTAAFAYRKTHPLGFNLYDENDQQVLYISDEPAGHVLNLEIHNTSQQSVALLRPDSATPGADNYHFELRFRPGTLPGGALPLLALGEVHLNQTKLDPKAWAFGRWRRTDNTDSLILLNTAAEGSEQAVTLAPDARLVLRIDNITADGRGGARGTRAELRYRRLGYPGSTAALDGYGVQQLSVVNQEGKKTLPLHAGFVGSGLVLNDGHTTNDNVKLRIASVLKDDNVAWKPGSTEDDSRFTIAFDDQGPNEKKEWALGTTDQVGQILIQATGGWEVHVNKEADPPEWFVTHATKTALAPGEDIQLTISNIITALPSGAAALYLHYANIPGYWDGLVTLPLVKTPIVYSGSNVGIGTNEPREALDTGKGLMAGAAADYMRAQFALTGGGLVTWRGPGDRLKWAQRFIAISMERGRTFAEGHVQIDMPTADIQKDYVYDGAARSVTKDGLLLNAWESLYAVHPVGGAKMPVTFRITNWTATTPFYAPSNWILVATVNGDPGDQSVKLGTGAFVAANSASSIGNALPRGVIVMWWGLPETLPPGWVVCDGANGAPDLRDKFIVGAGKSYNLSATGGANMVNLAVDQLPAHSHPASTGTAGNHYHEMLFDTGSGGSESASRMAKTPEGLQQNVLANYSAPTKYAGDHTHAVSVGNTGSGAAHENRPPFYALYYIMKL